MDVTDLDAATAKLAVGLRLLDIMEVLADSSIDDTDSTNSNFLIRGLQYQLDNMKDEALVKQGVASVTSDTSDEIYESAESANAESHQNPESDANSISEPKPESEIECDAHGCAVAASLIMKLVCSHVYCHECVTKLFNDCVHKDRFQYPPRCCGEAMPFSKCHLFLPTNLVKDVEAVHAGLERKTPGTAPSVLICLKLRTSREASVRAQNVKQRHARHVSSGNMRIYPEDPHDQAVKKVAEKAGWQKCSECDRVVQLEIGCFHIT
jgi:E3 ubiquitin-protein ligase RNF144